MEKLSTSKLLVLYEEILHFLESTGDNDITDFQKSLETNNYIKQKLLKLFPSLTTNEIISLLTILKIDRDKQKDNENRVEFVGTIPNNIESDLRKTISVVRQIILESEKSILITGYSISEFIKEILDLLQIKSQQGVKIQFFIDKGIKVENFFEQKLHNSNLQIFKLKINQNYSSLHAKVIVADNKKAFVSSSNLSYNGIVNNIEIGALVTGEKVRSITNLFEKLLKEDLFIELL